MNGKPKEPLTTEQKAQIATLSAGGWSQNKIAKEVGRSRTAVKNALAEPEIQKAVIDEKAELAELYRSKARAVVTSISDKDIDKASLQQKAISSGVLLDKSLLLAGEPTGINVNVLALLDVAKSIRARQERQTQTRTIEATQLTQGD